MIILLHTSKTMRPPVDNNATLQVPELIKQASELDVKLKKLSVKQIEKMMSVSPKLAATTRDLIAGWTAEQANQRTAIDSFLGDIYSGLQVHTWSDADRLYANEHLRILSGLYGLLKPLDGIYPYRFEMGYKLPNQKFKNMYDYWGDSVANTLPADESIVNLAALEYSKAVTTYIHESRFITPQFLTISSKTGEPTFVVVHAKIARGAFARWMIQRRLSDVEKLKEFNDIGYKYNQELSTDAVPTFVCQQFGGIGLSVRLS